MTSFSRREEAFEAKFAHDEERAFKTKARALHMLGLWAADKLRLRGAAAQDYARTLVEAEVDQVPNPAFERMVHDLADLGIDARRICEKRDALLLLASQSQSKVHPAANVRGLP